ncbi:hypothetical protein BH23ACT9_BH23ACT9_05560 [soil metagenome]
MTDFAPSDTAELLARIHASEPDVGLRLYDRFADRIYDFVLFLTRDSAMAAETTRDVVVMTANQDSQTLPDPAMLRAWLYAQARNETFALLSNRGRTPAEDRVVQLPELPDSPTAADLGALVWTAMGAFSERDQALVTLHLRHGLAGDALADAMGLSGSAVEVLLPTTLERVESQIAALLALATDQVPDGACADLHALHAEWDGMFSPLVRGRVTQMLDEAGGPLGTDAPGPMALLQTIPLVPAPASLREAVSERLEMATRLGAGPVASDPEIDDTLPPGRVDVVTIASGDDAATIPPGAGPPVVAGAREVAGALEVPAEPAPRVGETGAPASADSPAIEPVALRSGSGDRSGELTPVASRLQRPRTPMPLAIAMGVAVALVVAAGLLRLLTGEAPVTTLAASPPVSAAAAPSVQDESQAETPADALSVLPADPAPEPIVIPGRLSVPADSVVVQPDQPTPVRLRNTGGAPLEWRVLSLPGWVVMSQIEGSVEPGDAVEVEVGYVVPLPEGDYTGEITFAWEGGEPGTATVRMAGAVERLPDLQNLQIGSRELTAGGCGALDQTEVAVQVADESPLEAVVVTATGPSPEIQTQFGLNPDPAAPGRYVGTVGAFEAPGVVTLLIEATDVRGNRQRAEGGQLSIAPCPGG